MAEEDTEAPAGAAEGAPAPEPLSVAAAAALLADMPDEDESPEPERDEQGRFKAKEPEEQPEGEEPEAESEEPEQAKATGEEEAEGEASEDDPEETDAEDGPQPFDWDKVPGDAVFRLRDGDTVTGAEIKQNWDDLRQARQTRQEVERERAAFQQWMAESTQHHQHLETVIPHAIAALQAALPEIPEPPPDELNDSDPFAYQQQLGAHIRAKNDFEAKAAQIQQLHAARQMQAERASQEQEAQMQAYIHEQRQKLFEAVPELKGTERRQQFAQEFMELGHEYGFSDEELNKTYDHRIIRMAKDLSEARKKLARPKPKPEAAKPPRKSSMPVAKPGRRTPPGEVEQRQTREEMERVRQRGGDLREVARLFERVDN